MSLLSALMLRGGWAAGTWRGVASITSSTSAPPATAAASEVASIDASGYLPPASLTALDLGAKDDSTLVVIFYVGNRGSEREFRLFEILRLPFSLSLITLRDAPSIAERFTSRSCSLLHLFYQVFGKEVFPPKGWN